MAFVKSVILRDLFLSEYVLHLDESEVSCGFNDKKCSYSHQGTKAT